MQMPSSHIANIYQSDRFFENFSRNIFFKNEVMGSCFSSNSNDQTVEEDSQVKENQGSTD